MRVLVDTNVLIAAFATRGLCASLFEILVDQHIIICSDTILREVERNLSKKLKMSKSGAIEVITYLKGVCTFYEPSPVSVNACRDRSDLHVLGVAHSAKADLLLSGDTDLLILNQYKGIKIITPRELWLALSRK